MEETVRLGFCGFDPGAFLSELRPPAPNDLIDAELRLGTRPLGSAPGRAAGRTEGVPRPHLGWLSMLADLVMGTAYAAALGEGRTSLTLSMRIDSVRGALRPDVPIEGYALAEDPDDPGGVLHCLMLQGRQPVATGVGRFLPLGTRARSAPAEVVSFQRRGVDLATGFGLSGDWAPDIDVDLRAEGVLANPSGVVHGGVQAAIAAEAIIRSVAGVDASMCLLTDLSTRFLAPAPTGPEERLVVRVRRIHTGRSLRTVRVELVRGDGVVVSVSEGTVGRNPVMDSLVNSH
ncbi:PaaI family thioesterase [Microbacterium sp. No. 7]|uniref:PaaI family thioesterase n=1 Tax=Microbacterium sp. No. 7 TaxID=1714373 RepID=UPI0006D08FFC|nr:PaaI family thioesterase [Microbacterium sp. No. 7]ALJ21840.1 hypothetical protein AOA12_18835 [Microbacterium sp. No. 7]